LKKTEIQEDVKNPWDDHFSQMVEKIWKKPKNSDLSLQDDSEESMQSMKT